VIEKSKSPGELVEDRVVSATIHVACGDCGLRDALSIPWTDIIFLRDDLSWGPLGALDDLDSRCAVRAEYWEHPKASPPGRKKRRSGSKYVTRDYAIGDLDRLVNADEIVIWLGKGLAGQPARAWMPQLLRAIGGRPETLRVVQFERTLSGKSVPERRRIERRGIREQPESAVD
jgi:Domain of unknown function (DUF1835)